MYAMVPTPTMVDYQEITVIVKVNTQPLDPIQASEFNLNSHNFTPTIQAIIYGFMMAHQMPILYWEHILDTQDLELSLPRAML